MGYTRLSEDEGVEQNEQPQPRTRWWLHIALFIVTCISCFGAGVLWTMGSYEDGSVYANAALYTGLLMTFLLSHEFGHYLAARYHKVDASLPYTLPFPLISPFGTLGAVIAIRSPILSRKALFDIGVAGPLAGFVVSVIILIIGFATLPSIEALYAIHPEYRAMGESLPHYGITFGNNLLFTGLASIFANPNGFLPPMNEVYHYPFLCVGWFGLFVTSLNLLPVGQLDGGHVTYAMFGRRQGIIAKFVIAVLIAIGVGALLSAMYDTLKEPSPDVIISFAQAIFLPLLEFLHTHAPWLQQGWTGWLLWVLLARFVFGIEHKPIYDETPIGWKRMALGWAAIVVFVVSLAPNALYEVQPALPNDQGGGTKVVVQYHRDYAP